MQFCLGGDAPGRLLARYEAGRGALRAMPFWDLAAVIPAFRWLNDGSKAIGRSAEAT
jgi:hypothetical protein